MSVRRTLGFALSFAVQIFAVRLVRRGPANLGAARRSGTDCRYFSCSGYPLPPFCQTNLIACQSSDCDGRWCGGSNNPGGPAEPPARRRHHGPFSLLDPDHDEIVSREELHEVYKKAGIMDTRIVDELLDVLDKDDDGLVKFSELFKKMLQEQSEHAQKGGVSFAHRTSSHKTEKRGNQSSVTTSGSVCRSWGCDGPVLSESCQTDLVECQGSACGGVWCGGGGDKTLNHKARKFLSGLIDPDHNEFITREELYEVYSKAGVSDRQVVDELFDLLDRDNHGLVEVDEFLHKVLQDVALAQRTHKALEA